MANEIEIKFGTFELDDTNSVTVGGIDIKERKQVKLENIPKSDGSIAETAKRSGYTIDVEGDVEGADYDTARTNLDALKAALYNGKQKFTIDDDRYVMAQLQSFSVEPVILRRLWKWKATFVSNYPFWLSETEYTDDRDPTSGVGYTINNAGNAPTRLKVEVKAPSGDITDNCQLENTTRGELCKYRGTIAEGETLEIDNRYDTDDFEVLNNTVSDKANFEGDFLNLSAGDNTIEYTGDVGAGGDTITLTWRAAWY